MTNKVTLKGPTTGYLSSAQHLFNNNALTVALNNTISRDGSLPNEMLADFDLNGNRILNAPAPMFPTDVVRLEDLQAAVIMGVDTSPYRPRLRAFLEATGVPEANWATTNMHSAVTACAAACNAARAVGDISNCGPVCCDGPTIRFISGAGFTHEPNPLDSRMNATTGQIGTTFIRHETAYINKPVFSISSNCTLKCFGYFADRIHEGSFLDPTAYPTITSTLKNYAPFVCTDHTRDYNGNKVANGANIDWFTVECTVVGADTPFYFGDGDVTQETWATDFFSGTGKAIGGFRLVLKGMGLRRDLVLNRVVISSDVANSVLVDFGPQHWIELPNTRSNAQLLRDPTQTETPDQPLFAYRQKNCVSITGSHRWIGVTLKGKTRVCNTGLYFEAGLAPAGWIAAEAAVDAALVAASQPTQGYPAAHPDNGKYVSCDVNIAVEGVPTGLWIQPDAWIYRFTQLKLTGIFKDFIVSTTQPVINNLSDSTKAGTLTKKGKWVSVSQFTGGIDVELGVKIADGSLFRNTSAANQRRWKFSGWAANWGHGGDTSAGGIHGLWAFDNQSTSCYINAGLALYKGAYGSVRCFNTPALDNLYCNDLMEWFGYNTSVPPIDTTVCSIMAGFSPGGVCYPTWNATTDDGGDDGGGGSGDTVTVVVTPSSRSATRSGAGSLTSGSFTSSVTGGTAPYTYLWTRTAGSSAITATTPTASSTTCSATLGVGDDDTAIFTLSVTDANANVGSASVVVELSETGDVSPPEDLAVSIVPTSRSATRSGGGSLTTGNFVATASGGTPPYTYSWVRTAGDTAVTPTSPTTATTAATATLAPGDALSATFTLTVTDATLNTALGTVTATLVETS